MNDLELLRLLCVTVEAHLEPTFWPTPVLEWWRTEKRRLASEKQDSEKRARDLASAEKKLTADEVFALKESWK